MVSRAVPSIVIDSKIKVVGKPMFPWFCGDEFYNMLEREYPLKSIQERSTRWTDKKLEIMTSCGGGLGAASCTISMLLSVLIGTAGAGASIACSMPGMCGGVQLTGGLGIFVNAMTQIAQPLLVTSVALILYGMRRFGRLPLAISGMGGALLYVSMFALNMSLPLIAVSSIILIIGYGAAYVPLVSRSRHPIWETLITGQPPLPSLELFIGWKSFRDGFSFRDFDSSNLVDLRRVLLVQNGFMRHVRKPLHHKAGAKSEKIPSRKRFPRPTFPRLNFTVAATKLSLPRSASGRNNMYPQNPESVS
jgi:hypothetical protein